MKLKTGYIKTKYSEELHKSALEFAKHKMREDGKLNSKSERSDGGGIYLGYVSENLVAKKFNWIKEEPESRDYDLVTSSGTNIEVKCREVRVSLIPKKSYEAGIYTNYIQNCDYYIFTRIHISSRVCWFLGMISKEEFHKKCRDIPAKTVQSGNKKVWDLDIKNIFLRDLKWPKLVQESGQLSKFE